MFIRQSRGFQIKLFYKENAIHTDLKIKKSNPNTF